MTWPNLAKEITNTPTAVIESFLEGRLQGLPSVELLRHASLSGYAFARNQAQASDVLRGDFWLITTRHMAVKAEVARLLRAWKGSGVQALAYKGFYLAEFVYPTPGQRAYTDIDLLVRESEIAEAVRQAQGLGWEVLWQVEAPADMHSARDGAYAGHEAAQLVHPGLGVLIDLHRRLAHNNHNLLQPSRTQRRITDAAWEASTEVTWEGASLRLLQPVDALLIGLVINRCWGSDRWRIKPRDYADFGELVERFAITREALEERARELGCRRTFALFTARCDPFRRHVDLRPPSWLQQRSWNLQVARERGLRDLERSRFWIGTRPAMAAELAAAVPDLLRVLLLRRRTGDLRGLAPQLQLPVPSPRVLGYREWRGIQRGIRRGLRLLPIAPAERQGFEFLALLHALRRRGCPAVLEWGDGDARPRLLLDGRVLAVQGHGDPDR